MKLRVAEQEPTEHWPVHAACLAPPKQSASRGFTVFELVVVLIIIIVMVAMAVPLAQGVIRSFRLSAATTAIAGAIQSTRYQAIMRGCPYTITFSSSSTLYQVATQPLSGAPPSCAGTFSDVGGPVPWTAASNISLAAPATLQFNPNGIVTATSGSLSLAVSDGVATRTIEVSGVGNVTVKSH